MDNNTFTLAEALKPAATEDMTVLNDENGVFSLERTNDGYTLSIKSEDNCVPCIMSAIAKYAETHTNFDVERVKFFKQDKHAAIDERNRVDGEYEIVDADGGKIIKNTTTGESLEILTGKMSLCRKVAPCLYAFSYDEDPKNAKLGLVDVQTKCLLKPIKCLIGNNGNGIILWNTSGLTCTMVKLTDTDDLEECDVFEGEYSEPNLGYLFIAFDKGLSDDSLYQTIDALIKYYNDDKWCLSRFNNMTFDISNPLSYVFENNSNIDLREKLIFELPPCAKVPNLWENWMHKVEITVYGDGSCNVSICSDVNIRVDFYNKDLYLGWFSKNPIHFVDFPTIFEIDDIYFCYESHGKYALFANDNMPRNLIDLPLDFTGLPTRLKDNYFRVEIYGKYGVVSPHGEIKTTILPIDFSKIEYYDNVKVTVTDSIDGSRNDYEFSEVFVVEKMGMCAVFDLNGEIKLHFVRKDNFDII